MLLLAVSFSAVTCFGFCQLMFRDLLALDVLSYGA